MTQTSRAGKSVVYTALIGSYEVLQEQPVGLKSRAEFICFTDNPSLKSTTWTIRVIDDPQLIDQVRTARRLKIVRPVEVQLFERSLWIDNRVILKVDPDEILDQWLAGSVQIAMPLHDHRDRVRDEFAQVLRAGLDDPRRVRRQLSHYDDYFGETLTQAPLWTALIARRRSLSVEHFERVWWDQVAVFSRRDQLSVRVALREFTALREISLANRESDIHSWLTEMTLKKDIAVHAWSDGVPLRGTAVAIRDFLMSVPLVRRWVLRGRRLLVGEFRRRL